MFKLHTPVHSLKFMWFFLFSYSICKCLHIARIVPNYLTQYFIHSHKFGSKHVNDISACWNIDNRLNDVVVCQTWLIQKYDLSQTRIIIPCVVWYPIQKIEQSTGFQNWNKIIFVLPLENVQKVMYIPYTWMHLTRRKTVSNNVALHVVVFSLEFLWSYYDLNHKYRVCDIFIQSCKPAAVQSAVHSYEIVAPTICL